MYILLLGHYTGSVWGKSLFIYRKMQENFKDCSKLINKAIIWLKGNAVLIQLRPLVPLRPLFLAV